MMGETNVKAYQDFDMYQQLSSITLQSMLEYSNRWGYPVFYQNEFLMDKSRQAYWSKIQIIRHYLEMGFEYILYTDIDVLFTNPDKNLDEFIVEGYDLIGVNECKDRMMTNDAIRSGFMMFRNSPRTYKLLDAWASMFSAFENIPNPEQTALEKLVQQEEFKDQVILHDWTAFHSYDTCSGGGRSFSMHFPGAYKTERIARVVVWFEMNGMAFFSGLMADLSREILLNGLISVEKIPLSMPDQYDIEEAIRSMQDESYNVFTDVEKLELLKENVWRYEETSFYWAIPNVVYFTVKDKTSIHPDIEERLLKWRDINPSFEIIVHDDNQVDDLVLSMLPRMNEQAWRALEPVQRTDIYRYVVIQNFGGWYFDADVDAVRSIANWGHEPHQTLVVGVEADNYADAPKHEGARPLMFSQYSFGAAPQHPALTFVLDKIVDIVEQGRIEMGKGMSVEERLLHVLTTTGPVVWTDSIMEFLTLSASVMGQKPQSPLDLHMGGNNMNTKIFSISGFGCGQFHSNSPACDQEDVNIWHRFGGSQYFGGKRWQAVAPEQENRQLTTSVSDFQDPPSDAQEDGEGLLKQFDMDCKYMSGSMHSTLHFSYSHTLYSSLTIHRQATNAY